MSAGAVFKFHGRFGSFNEIVAHVRAGSEYPPQIGDTALYVTEDGTVCDCDFGPSGWHEKAKRTPDGSTSIDGIWGGEDTGVAIAAFHAGCRLVGLDPSVSYVQHEPHPPWAVTRKNLERMGEFESTLTGDRM